MNKISSFATGKFYHVVNYGIEKRIVFLERRDCKRFISTLEYYSSAIPPVRYSFRKRVSAQKQERKQPEVEIIAYCLMPDHFHLLLKQTKDVGISKFLSKLANSYTKYFNNKYRRAGPLFRGKFNAINIESKDQLLLILRHVHLNPLIHSVVKNLDQFPYSSHIEYLGFSLGFCNTKYILGNFKNRNLYREFISDQENYKSTIMQIKNLILEDSKVVSNIIETKASV